MRCREARLGECTLLRIVSWLPLWVRSWRVVRATLNKRLVITGAELRRYGNEHCLLRQGRERAELVGGGQWAEPRALRCAGVGWHGTFSEEGLQDFAIQVLDSTKI